MPDIREVRVTITTREDGRAHARSHEVPGLLLSAEDAQAMLPNISVAIQTTFLHQGFSHVDVKLINRTKYPNVGEEEQLYEVDLGD
jgi:hypothetical protein